MKGGRSGVALQCSAQRTVARKPDQWAHGLCNTACARVPWHSLSCHKQQGEGPSTQARTCTAASTRAASASSSAASSSSSRCLWQQAEVARPASAHRPASGQVQPSLEARQALRAPSASLQTCCSAPSSPHPVRAAAFVGFCVQIRERGGQSVVRSVAGQHHETRPLASLLPACSPLPRLPCCTW